MSEPPLHPACSALELLLGTWRGEGEGWYPTIDDFGYHEELTFSHVGKPFLAMVQRTRDAGSGLPLHSEFGYLRPQADQVVELVVAQPSGIVEVDAGSVTQTEGGVEIVVESLAVHGTPTAKSVTGVRRRLAVSGDELVSEGWMEAVGVGMDKHLRAELRRDRAD